jgi:hypothetical protein
LLRRKTAGGLNGCKSRPAGPPRKHAKAIRAAPQNYVKSTLFRRFRPSLLHRSIGLFAIESIQPDTAQLISTREKNVAKSGFALLRSPDRSHNVSPVTLQIQGGL